MTLPVAFLCLLMMYVWVSSISSLAILSLNNVPIWWVSLAPSLNTTEVRGLSYHIQNSKAALYFYCTFLNYLLWTLNFQTISSILCQILKPHVSLSGKCWELWVDSTDSQHVVRCVWVSSVWPCTPGSVTISHLTPITVYPPLQRIWPFLLSLWLGPFLGASKTFSLPSSLGPCLRPAKPFWC